MTKLLETAALEAALQEFARQRDWDQFHTPRNLILALTGEVGELAEIPMADRRSGRTNHAQ